MNKKKIALIILSVVIVSVGIIVAVRIQKEKEMDFGEFSERFEQAAEEVLGEDVKKIISNSSKGLLSGRAVFEPVPRVLVLKSNFVPLLNHWEIS